MLLPVQTYNAAERSPTFHHMYGYNSLLPLRAAECRISDSQTPLQSSPNDVGIRWAPV